MSKECAACGSKRVTIQDKPYTFTHGNKKFGDEIDLTAVLPVYSCGECELELVDYKGQKIIDIAVKRYLEKGKTFYKPVKVWSLLSMIFSVIFILLSLIWIFVSLDSYF